MKNLRMSLLLLILATPLVAPAQLKMPPTKSSKQALKKHKARQKRQLDRTLKILAAMSKRVESVDFDEAPLDEVLEWFKEQGLVNMVIRWKTLENDLSVDPQTPITLAFDDVTVGEVFDLVWEQASIDALDADQEITYHIVGGIIQVATREYFNRKEYTRTYYVEDLLYPIHLNALLPVLSIGQQRTIVTQINPVLAPGAGGGGGVPGGGSGGGVAFGGGGTVVDSGSTLGPGDHSERPDFQSIREAELANLIALIKTLRPETWIENGGSGSVSSFGSKLIIRNNIEVQEMVGGLFAEMSRIQQSGLP